jgi:mRNA interferase HigB
MVHARQQQVRRLARLGPSQGGFQHASLVGNCVVFNIGGNNYRLVTRPLYASQKVFVLKVMTHAEYDDNKWQETCGCFAPASKQTQRKQRRKER